MRRSIVGVIVLLGSVLLAGQTAGAAPMQRQVSVSASKAGLTLVMLLPGHTYPRGATVPVTLRLHNASSGIRVLWVWDCANPPYGAQVLNRSGRVVYPRGNPAQGVRPCVGNMAPMLAPGKTITYHLKVVLKGPLVRARIPFGVPAAGGDTHQILSTRAVRVGGF